MCSLQSKYSSKLYTGYVGMHNLSTLMNISSWKFTFAFHGHYQAVIKLGNHVIKYLQNVNKRTQSSSTIA